MRDAYIYIYIYIVGVSKTGVNICSWMRAYFITFNLAILKIFVNRFNT